MSYLLIILVVIFVLIEILLRYTVKKFQYIYYEFPVFNVELLKKFTSYDSILGWEPKATVKKSAGGELRPNTSKNRSDASTHKYSINKDGSRFQPKTVDQYFLNTPIEFFGDSACFCRNVNDHETFSFYLESNHKIGPTKNFGAGNYGSDQSYLRAEKRLQGNGISVLFVTTKAFTRNLAVYKHYSEPGNYWAVKPRFTYRDGKLIKIDRPFVEKQELADLHKYRAHFRSFDDHYLEFQKMSPVGKKIYLFKFLINFNTRIELWKRIGIDSRKNLVRKIFKIISKIENKIYHVVFLNRNIEKKTLDMISGEAGELFAGISHKFCELAISRKSRPFIILTPQGEMVRKEITYKKTVSILREKFNRYNIDLYDFGDAIFQLNESDIKRFKLYSNHLSPDGNKFLADWIAQLIKAKS